MELIQSKPRFYKCSVEYASESIPVEAPNTFPMTDYLRHTFATLSFVAEIFIFVYVGMDALDIEKWSFVSDRQVLHSRVLFLYLLS